MDMGTDECMGTRMDTSMYVSAGHTVQMDTRMGMGMNMCMAMRMDMCIGIYVDMCMDVCMAKRMDMCLDMNTDMCVDLCMERENGPLQGQACVHADGHVQ